MSIVLQGSTSGSITLQEPAIAGSTVLDLPATSGTVLTSASPASDLPSSIKGPAFSAVPTTASQTPAISTFTKVTLGTELFDTNNNFASSTFTPTVAGYYQINASVNMLNTVSRLIVSIYKNGTEWCRGFDVNSNSIGGTLSQIMYLNGSTDYVEMYTFNAQGGSTISNTNAYTCFSGCLVRAA